MGSYSKYKKEQTVKKSKIYEEYCKDRVGSSMLTLDGGIYLTRAGAFEFVNICIELEKIYPKLYLQKELTKDNVRKYLEENVWVNNIIPLYDEFKWEWTNVVLYYFRLGNLKLFVGKEIKTLPHKSERIMKGENTTVYRDHKELEPEMKKWELWDLFPH